MNNFYIVLLILSFATHVNADITRRAAIDIGSGGTKVAIADVDTETNQIVDILLDKSFPVPYQASLDKSLDGTFDQETKALGLKTFKEISNLAEQYDVRETAAIATSAFRKANNSKSFIADVEKETGIKLDFVQSRVKNYRLI